MRLFFFLILLYYCPNIWAQSIGSKRLQSEWDSLGYEFVELLNGRSTEIDYYFDSDAFWKRLVIRNPKQENIQKLNKELLSNAGKFRISAIFSDVGDNVAYKFLRTRADSLLVVQQRIDDLEFNYLFFKLQYLENDWKIVDVYFLVYDTYLSALIKNTVYFPIVFEALERDNAATILENSKIFRESKHLYGEGEVERAYTKLSGIPQEERLKDYQVYKVCLAGKVEDDRKLLRSVEEYKKMFGEEDVFSLLFLDYYVLIEDYDKALQTLWTIDSIVGGDPYLEFYQGLIYYLKDDWKNCLAVLERSVLSYPEEEYYFIFLIGILEERRAYRRAVKIMEQCVRQEYYEVYSLANWAKAEYPALARSGPFKRWLRRYGY